ncbi:MAG: phosphotransferase family protein [Candidatus Bathyarchaeia archaeon]
MCRSDTEDHSAAISFGEEIITILQDHYEGWRSIVTVKLNKTALAEYLSVVYGCPVKLRSLAALTGKGGKVRRGVKGFGYGIPYLIQFQGGRKKLEVVLSTMKRNGFGHDHEADVAQNMVLANACYNDLAKHVKAIDVGAFTSKGALKPLGDCVDFFLLTERVTGREYFHDFLRVMKQKRLSDLDRRRCLALSDYLVEIHSVRKHDANLYRRRIRDLVGHGECIMGITDGYPADTAFVTADELMRVEQKTVEWRWRIKDKAHRLCQVHGDFHPWNILFRRGADFTVLDRSRGVWGEAADDVSSLTLNYVFFSMQIFGKLQGPFEELYDMFMENYLKKTGDKELLRVIQPFYAWRALVLASPVWYPNLSTQVRQGLVNFIFNILNTEEFHPSEVNEYLQAKPDLLPGG